MNVLLLIPPRAQSTVFLRSAYFPPIGIAYLAAYTRARAGADGLAFTFTILDCTAEGITFADFAGRLRKIRPQVVGISFYTVNRFDAVEAIGIVKQADPSIFIVGGGSHPTLAADDTMANVLNLDAIVRGEGEETFYELLRALAQARALDGIAGLSFRNGSGVVHNPARPHVSDLDSLPLPAYDLLNMERYYGTMDWGKSKEKEAMLITSRGCPYRCNFCASARAWGNRYRMRSPGSIIGEIKFLVDRYAVSAILFFDDTMTINKTRSLDICRRISAEKISIRWITHSRVDVMDEELMRAMKDAGCVGIMFGVEAGSQRLIDEVIGKKISIDKVRQVSEMSRELGMTNNFSYILSHPTETFEEAEQSLDLCRKHLQDGQTVAVNIMQIYPGTEVETYALEHHLLPEGFRWSKKMAYDSGVVSRTIKGDVPFFRDRMTWDQIFTLNSRFLKLIKYPVFKHGWDALKNIRSVKDFLELARLGIIHFMTTSAGRPGRR